MGNNWVKQKWNGTFYETTTLKLLGLRIQLGHPIGQPCANPDRAFGDDFVVIDITGIHSVGLDFCNCELAQQHRIQLLRFRWFPATTSNPRSAATFRLLKHFHMLTFESKASGFEFYHALTRETDNSGVIAPKVHRIASIYS